MQLKQTNHIGLTVTLHYCASMESAISHSVVKDIAGDGIMILIFILILGNLVDPSIIQTLLCNDRVSVSSVCS